MFLDALDSVYHKYELYKNLMKIILDKGTSQTYQQYTRVTQQRAQCIQYTRVVNPNALALATSTRLLGIADKEQSFISYQRLSP